MTKIKTKSPRVILNCLYFFPEKVRKIFENYIEDFVEEDGMLEDNNQNLIEDEYEVDSLTNKNHLDNLSEKLNDDYENVQSRDCPSRFSTLTSSSKFSTTRINSKEPSK
jgi:hypothetical protein